MKIPGISCLVFIIFTIIQDKPVAASEAMTNLFDQDQSLFSVGYEQETIVRKREAEFELFGGAAQADYNYIEKKPDVKHEVHIHILRPSGEQPEDKDTGFLGRFFKKAGNAVKTAFTGPAKMMKTVGSWVDAGKNLMG